MVPGLPVHQQSTTQFHELELALFWEMAHWLGRKFKMAMPIVMQRFKRDNTFVAGERHLLRPTEFSSLQYRQRFFKPNPFLTQDTKLAREELPHESYWTGYEARPGMADLRPLIWNETNIAVKSVASESLTTQPR
jgi:hypothetical protein